MARNRNHAWRPHTHTPVSSRHKSRVSANIFREFCNIGVQLASAFLQTKLCLSIFLARRFEICFNLMYHSVFLDISFSKYRYLKTLIRMQMLVIADKLVKECFFMLKKEMSIMLKKKIEQCWCTVDILLFAKRTFWVLVLFFGNNELFSTWIVGLSILFTRTYAGGPRQRLVEFKSEKGNMNFQPKEDILLC